MSSAWRVLRLLGLVSVSASQADAQLWSVQRSGQDTSLRGVSVVMPDGARDVVVWASGSNGVILRSTDKGMSWQQLHVAGGETLDFRAIVGFDEKIAYVLSSGEGEKSRIYKTRDGGQTWTLQFTDKRKAFFLDALVCNSEQECYALSDPIDGKFLILRTTDGKHWEPLPSGKMPAALPGEGAFAASGTSLAIFDRRELFFGTGGPAARVFHSDDLGESWTVAGTPIANGNASSGIFSIEARTGRTIVAVGGDYKDPNRPDRVAAFSKDAGQTWQLATAPPGGYRSAVASINGTDVMAVGPTGEEVSFDMGAHWQHTDNIPLNALAFANPLNGWAVGPNGTIARFINHIGYEARLFRLHDSPR